VYLLVLEVGTQDVHDIVAPKKFAIKWAHGRVGKLKLFWRVGKHILFLRLQYRRCGRPSQDTPVCFRSLIIAAY
jgi:hypothetical protein